ncbi:MAG: sensor histidine kinase, partial [Bacteroidales bacterium]|nr:sensor histidine kinase [Bacteroidales bacterium]
KVEESKLIFHCENSLNRQSAEGPKVDSGIGLDNVTKRLQLLYPNRHELQIDSDENRFIVNLTIQTKESLA